MLLLITFALQISFTFVKVGTEKAEKIMVDAAFDLVE